MARGPSRKERAAQWAACEAQEKLDAQDACWRCGKTPAGELMRQAFGISAHSETKAHYHDAVCLECRVILQQEADQILKTSFPKMASAGGPPTPKPVEDWRHLNRFGQEYFKDRDG